MNLELQDRNCVILGGGCGIGRSIAIGLAEEGANVAIFARGEDALAETELLKRLLMSPYSWPHRVPIGLQVNALLLMAHNIKECVKQD